MNAPLLERVLSCPNLPSLPGVAVKVLSLTRDPNVSLTTIAQTVQADPALAVRVLKTVNSSYYGLASPCPSIMRAMTMLGLNTVKAIVLGFSLVESTRGCGLSDGEDMAGYWRRAAYSATAARSIALAARCCDPEEAFIGALVQDIGVLACLASLKNEYRAVLAQRRSDHDEAAAVETMVLGFDHQHVGRLLSEKWRLPPQIVECVANHHNPARCSPAYEKLVRCVHLGGLVASTLTVPDHAIKLGAFLVKSKVWLGVESATGRAIIEQAAAGGRELSKLLEVPTGEAPNVAAILSEAHEQMALVQEAVQVETAQLRRSNDELARQTMTDGLTGAFNRTHFDRTLRVQFEQCKAAGMPLSVVFIDADHFKTVNDEHGHQTGDAVLMELADRLKAVTPGVGVLCRYGGEEFAIVLPGIWLDEAARIGEACREVCAGTPFDLTRWGVGLKLRVTISVGVSSMDKSSAHEVSAPEQITHAADQGLYRAKHEGRNRTCVASLSEPRRVAAERKATTVMIVEDDPLASRLLAFLFSKNRDLKTVVVRTGEEAVEWIASPSAARPRPDAVVCDLHLPGMSGATLVRSVRETCGRALPCLVVSAATAELEQRACLDAGADDFVEKSEFCSNPDRWLSRVVELVDRSRAAA
jgi:two-component system, cell cycle response regulator